MTTGASTKGADATAYQGLPCLGSPQVTRLSSRVDKIMLKEAALLFFAGDFRNCISIGGSSDQKSFFWLSLAADGWRWRLLTPCLSSDVCLVQHCMCLSLLTLKPHICISGISGLNYLQSRVAFQFKQQVKDKSFSKCFFRLLSTSGNKVRNYRSLCCCFDKKHYDPQ